MPSVQLVSFKWNQSTIERNKTHTSLVWKQDTVGLPETVIWSYSSCWYCTAVGNYAPPTVTSLCAANSERRYWGVGKASRADVDSRALLKSNILREQSVFSPGNPTLCAVTSAPPPPVRAANAVLHPRLSVWTGQACFQLLLCPCPEWRCSLSRLVILQKHGVLLPDQEAHFCLLCWRDNYEEIGNVVFVVHVL